MDKREWLMHLALTSVRKLRQEIDKLTPEELTACLEFELESRQRKYIVQILTDRLADLTRQNFINNIKEQLRGTQTLSSS